MLQKTSIIRGSKIHATDGDIGHVTDLYFDDSSWAVLYLVVDTGPWLFGRKVLICPAAIKSADWSEREISVSLTKEQVENSPDIDVHKPVSRQQMDELHEYYGWPAAVSGPAVAGTLPFGTYPVGVPGGEVVEKGAEQPEAGTEDLRLRSAREVIGYHVDATDAEMGHVEDFIIDDINWVIRYTLIETGDLLPGKKVLIAQNWICGIHWLESEITLRLPSDKIKSSPEYDPDEPVGRNYEELLHHHYESRGYWE